MNYLKGEHLNREIEILEIKSYLERHRGKGEGGEDLFIFHTCIIVLYCVATVNSKML